MDNRTPRHKTDRNTNRRVLNCTTASVGGPSLLAPSNVAILQCAKSDGSREYNEYLVAHMKKLIVKETIDKHQTVLNRQLLYRNQDLRKKNQQVHSLNKEIELLEIQNNVGEILTSLEKYATECKTIINGYKLYFETFWKYLKDESENVKLENVKVINNQEEYDKLMKVLENLRIVTDKIVISNRDFEKIHKIAESIRIYNEQKNIVKEKQEQTHKRFKNIFYDFLEDVSNMLAEKYEE
ncbi:unnamed protein product [Acanthoscelides obtectus]|uniref:Uncharacterized protein n=1 Tax=Acanthoscelides obtectus TaxID=200917 RepID=A0A9P0K597_ACAOB|nr:unnamed protein product [Acanthoscelides obtectus]CAK1666366.1 hypothetical protein AOBTE_LOCUS25274 [Acanthoscelides obtectus]